VSKALALVMLVGPGIGLDRHIDGASRVMRRTIPMIGTGPVVTTIMPGGWGRAYLKQG
jgi:hypothetical protein